MPLDLQRARPLLQSGDFARLFREELGWEPASNTLALRVDGNDFALSAFAEKRGFTAWLCECPSAALPVHPTRTKLERKLAETSYEHLLVFASPTRDHQSWMWVRRESGKPLAVRTHEYFRSQPGDSLLQKLDALYISFDDEEAGITVAEVAGRARAAFDVERVTKTFYRDFDGHRKAFVKFIDGISVVTDRDWYASVMLNRLMFVYFIQRKGFLDGDRAYLRNRLKRCQQEQGRDRFYSFYRYFLLRLFHEGFGRRRKDRTPDLEKLLGNIPYLNGGIFDVHELEKPERYGKEIQIPDKAFERIFDYFDEWQWHLDERPLRADNEINPDVLGYIFEKYINQKQMGAYYTKEDITDYIGKNTVLPFLLDAARAKCKVAFESTAGFQPAVWELLRENPDRYIYAPVRHGVDLPLPAEIERGIDTSKPNLIARRAGWNRPAPPEYALPTEIWREDVARRQRCTELRRKLAAGEVREANDLITLNLDIRQFVQDVVAQCEGPDLLRAFWQALIKVTVLDPTCGSGAFLFAVLNLLEPLYEACLDRMEAFLADLDRSGEQHRPEKFADFRAVLDRVAAHQNRRYFIFKSITLQNLYGVDIMEEAVEICKLRLFLKLAAQVSPQPEKDNLGIEPLPDIDFNIRAGNTLVGYATYAEVQRAVTSALDFDNAMEKIAVRAADLQQTFDAFRQRQTEGDGSVPAAHKQEVQKRLSALREELNRHLATDYGIDVRDKAAYAKWTASHQPFHWFVEFYGILKAGGFDVIIGNPPYVEYSQISNDYTLRDLGMVELGNLHGMVTKRSLTLLAADGCISMIVPVALPSTDRFAGLRAELGKRRSVWISHYDFRPAKLFEGAEQRLTIFINRSSENATVYSTKYNRWYVDQRPTLFPMLAYFQWDSRRRFRNVWPKLAGAASFSLIQKVASQPIEVTSLMGNNAEGLLFYKNTGVLYWTMFTREAPRCFINGTRQSSSRETALKLRNARARNVLHCALNSTLFFVLYQIHSNCRDLNPSDIQCFRVPQSLLDDQQLGKLSERLHESQQSNSEFRIRNQKLTGEVRIQTFSPGANKLVFDEIDTVLARHYGFTEEELDFVINYDIKYRLGRDTGDDE